MSRITKEQGEYIKQHYNQMAVKEIAANLNLNAPQVISWARNHGVPKKNRSIFSDADKTYIQANYLQVPYAQIADHLGFTERQIKGWINNNLANKNRVFRSDYFSDIRNTNRAYWLGFIYADGWIVHSRETSSYEFGMQLRRGDRYVLEALNVELGGVHKIFDEEFHGAVHKNSVVSHSESSVLRVYSKELVEDLMQLGIDVRKTESDTFPTVPDECFVDFLRGYFDGDGSLSIDSRGRNLRWDITGTNYGCFAAIQKTLSENHNISTSIYKHGERTWKLVCFRKDDVRNLLNLLYSDTSAMRLERKYKIYSDYYCLAA